MYFVWNTFTCFIYIIYTCTEFKKKMLSVFSGLYKHIHEEFQE